MFLQKVLSKKTLKKFLIVSCQPLTEKAGSGSVSQWYGTADPDPSRIHDTGYRLRVRPWWLVCAFCIRRKHERNFSFLALIALMRS
jgi:hypothetical protein